MEFMTTKHKLPEKCNPTDWLGTATKNVVEDIRGYITAGFSKEAAIHRVRQESCAGPKVWKLALEQI